MYAPSYIRASVKRALRTNKETTYKRHRTSTQHKDDHVHKLPSGDVGVESPLDPVSNSFG